MYATASAARGPVVVHVTCVHSELRTGVSDDTITDSAVVL
jgi:hypothetical protein